MNDHAGPWRARTIETIQLQIGGIPFGIEADSSLGKRLRLRYGDFARTHGPRLGTPRLRIEAWLADAPAGPAMLPSVRLKDLGDGRVSFSGDCCASLDLKTGTGRVTKGNGLAGVDTLLRLSLSLLAPEEGWVLLHGAAIQLATGNWALLLGQSGAGKSTAARAFVSHCDELVLARWERDRAEAASTPYWNGTPGRAKCEAIVCLERSEAPGSRRLRGSEAVRALLPHVVRHVRRDTADRILFGRLLELAEGVPVLRARLNTGPTYVTRLGAEMERHGFAPRWKMPGKEQVAPSGSHARQGGSRWR